MHITYTYVWEIVNQKNATKLKSALIKFQIQGNRIYCENHLKRSALQE